MNILKDVKAGNLPAREIPAFCLWLMRKSFWLWFVLIVVGWAWMVLK